MEMPVPIQMGKADSWSIPFQLVKAHRTITFNPLWPLMAGKERLKLSASIRMRQR